MVQLLFDEMPFGFLDSPESSFGSVGYCDDLDGEEHQPSFDLQESKAFWDQQLQNLQATLYRTNSVESKIRQATKEILEEAKSWQWCCSCGRRDANTGLDCRDCLRREVCNRLIKLGFDCAVCKSEWKGSHTIPSGEHTYLEVLDKWRSGELRVIVEINFRSEFEMARASEDYNRLIARLPEFYIGKSERLRDLIKILCGAAKRCMEEKNMHLGPWRKHKYVQAKWLGGSRRSSTAPLPAGGEDSGRVAARYKASMLTFDL